MSVEHYFYTLIPMGLAACFFWLISLIKKDVSIVDSLWSLFFIIACTYYFSQIEALSLRAQIIMIMVIIWGLRLSAYITIRHWGQEEDHRYQTIRKNNNPGFQFKSLYLIFAFQTIVAWIIAMPLFYGMSSNVPLNWLDSLGIILWMIGLFFEVIGDYQLWKFKRNKENKGKILTRGLWQYTRHPNYFGEFLIWWSYFFIAINSEAYWIIISPLLMTFLLLKFSGVVHLENTMKIRPGYEEYMKNTNAFIPGFNSGGNR